MQHDFYREERLMSKPLPSDIDYTCRTNMVLSVWDHRLSDSSLKSADLKLAGAMYPIRSIRFNLVNARCLCHTYRRRVIKSNSV